MPSWKARAMPSSKERQAERKRERRAEAAAAAGRKAGVNGRPRDQDPNGYSIEHWSSRRNTNKRLKRQREALDAMESMVASILERDATDYAFNVLAAAWMEHEPEQVAPLDDRTPKR